LRLASATDRQTVAKSEIAVILMARAPSETCTDRAAGGRSMAGDPENKERPGAAEKPPHYHGHRKRLRERFLGTAARRRMVASLLKLCRNRASVVQTNSGGSFYLDTPSDTD
jgi:hypothetical protein